MESVPQEEGEKIIKTRGIGLSLLFALGIFVVLEIALQVRSQIRHGESVFSASSTDSKYIRNEALGIRTLRPSAEIKSASQIIVTNRYGLRGADFEPKRLGAEVRIAQLGASTIQGAYAPNNDHTSSMILERLLNKDVNGASVKVINAGIDGTTLGGQVRVLKWLASGLHVQQVIWYPGTNDISCRAVSASRDVEPVRISWPGLPRWTLTNDLIVMNTAFIRRSNVSSNPGLVKDFDLDQMRKSIEEGVTVAKEAGVSIVLVTAATNYRAGMPADEISKRASTALFFRPCYAGVELAEAVSRFNQMIRDVASASEVPLIDAEREMPPDPSLFGDANHFSPRGEERYADIVASELLVSRLLPGGRGR